MTDPALIRIVAEALDAVVDDARAWKDTRINADQRNAIVYAMTHEALAAIPEGWMRTADGWVRVEQIKTHYGDTALDGLYAVVDSTVTEEWVSLDARWCLSKGHFWAEGKGVPAYCNRCGIDKSTVTEES